MPRRKKIVEEEAPKTPAPSYRIKHLKGGVDLLQNGEWLGTYKTEAEAQAEMEHRQAFDKIRGGAPV